MNKTLLKANELKDKCKGYWASRIICQIGYAFKVSGVNEYRFNSLIEDAVEYLYKGYCEEGTITRSMAQKAESIMAEMSKAAKDFKMICAAHAHIDMNWMWGFPETVAITLDTFRTMLDLMEEYPQYKFSQSQASVYRIVEEYNPAMLEEIKKRIKEGRWEVTASTWVETDKNMPNGESLARHILYTKKYLSKLLGINPDSLKIDFEPDTFGHSLNVPEILNKGGVEYYYHCRGYDGHNIYRWKSPSGSSVVVYREPSWYNADIEPSMVLYVPEFCTKYGIDTALKVYGVGDHGGGPTRKDIERIIDMSGWPVYPEISFGSFSQYFDTLKNIKDKLPVEDKELNFVFTGCYTSQSRIKTANRIGEAKLNEAESFSSISAAFAGGGYKSECFKEAWENVLFNHFHDILPGSGVIDTREYAMGLFQKTAAIANTQTAMALGNIASRIDTSQLFNIREDISETRSEGAGVGYGIMDFSLPQTERGSGINRIFHLFNPSDCERRELVEIVVWDWEGSPERILFRNSSGEKAEHQVVENKEFQHGDSRYWGHKYLKLLVDAVVPAYGYSTYTLSELEPDGVYYGMDTNPRVEVLKSYVLENENLRVEFDSKNASIISLYDKKDGNELVESMRPAGVFRLVEEADGKKMTSWVVGRYMDVLDLNSNENVKILGINSDGKSLRQWIEYEIKFRDSRLKVNVSLARNCTRIDFNVECDWQERAVKGGFVPQLNFYVPFGYMCKNYKYDIPFGTIERPGMDMDVPANSWALGVPRDKGSRALMLVTASKYGFRGKDNSLAVTLIRSSYYPDPYPENNIHKFRFALNALDGSANIIPVKQAFDYNHPISFLSGKVHKGDLPLQKSFINAEGENAVVSAVKMPENGSSGSLIIRVYETEGTRTDMAVAFAKKIKKAYYVDINENAVQNSLKIDVLDKRVKFEIDAFSVENICVEFDS